MQKPILLYQTIDANVNVEVTYVEETFWLTQKEIAQFFGVERSVVTKHLKNLFETNELSENSVSAKFAHTAEDGKTYQTNFYNLDTIIAVGYRVNSKQATQFRIWATQTFKRIYYERICFNDEMLKNGTSFFKTSSFPRRRKSKKLQQVSII